MSQISLAFKAGIHISYIGRLERAESAAGIDTVERLAEALGVSPAELLEGGPTDKVSLESVRHQARANVEKALVKGDITSIQALSIMASALAQRH